MFSGGLCMEDDQNDQPDKYKGIAQLEKEPGKRQGNTGQDMGN